jgi:hypothetical protein
MSRVGYFIWFASLGIASLLVAQLIRVRLKKHHPGLFARFGYPSIQDSNLQGKYWFFQKFVLWGHISEADDTVLHGLCVLASVANLGVLISFFLCI